jgi:hypothetical protein
LKLEVSQKAIDSLAIGDFQNINYLVFRVGFPARPLIAKGAKHPDNNRFWIIRTTIAISTLVRYSEKVINRR